MRKTANSFVGLARIYLLWGVTRVPMANLSEMRRWHSSANKRQSLYLYIYIYIYSDSLSPPLTPLSLSLSLTHSLSPTISLHICIVRERSRQTDRGSKNTIICIGVLLYFEFMWSQPDHLSNQNIWVILPWWFPQYQFCFLLIKVPHINVSNILNYQCKIITQRKQMSIIKMK